MDKTFVLFYRSFLDDPRIISDSEFVSVYIFLLLKAQYQRVDMRGHVLEIGELDTTQLQMSEKLNITVVRIKYIIKRLKEFDKISVRKAGRVSIIKLNNFEKYQGKKEKTPVAGTTEDEPPTTNEDTIPPEEPKEKKFNPRKMELPDDVSRDVWNEYLDKRINLKCSNTERALRMQLNGIPELLSKSESGTTADNIIEQSIDNGWKKLVANKQMQFGYNQKEDKGLYKIRSEEETKGMTTKEFLEL